MCQILHEYFGLVPERSSKYARCLSNIRTLIVHYVCLLLCSCRAKNAQFHLHFGCLVCHVFILVSLLYYVVFFLLCLALEFLTRNGPFFHSIRCLHRNRWQTNGKINQKEYTNLDSLSIYGEKTKKRKKNWCKNWNICVKILVLYLSCQQLYSVQTRWFYVIVLKLFSTWFHGPVEPFI